MTRNQFSTFNFLFSILLCFSTFCFSAVSTAQTLPITLEAENAQLFGDLKIKPTNGTTISGLSGGRYIGDFHQVAKSYLVFPDVQIPTEGTYELRVYSMGSSRAMSVKVNQYAKSVLYTGDSPAWDDAPAVMVSTLIYLDAGKNRLTFGTHNDNGPNLDKFEIHRTSQSIPKPEIIKLAYVGDFTDNAILTAQHTTDNLNYAIDNDEYTIYRAAGLTQTQITVECQTPFMLTAYLLSAGIHSSENVKQWLLEYSKNGSDWLTVATNNTTDLSGATLFELNRSYASANNLSARYYRLTAKGATDVEVAEFQLFGVPYEHSADFKTFPEDIFGNLDISTAARAFPVGAANNQFKNLFDRSLRTKYFIAGSCQFYVEIELDKAYRLHNYTLTSGTDFADRDPKRWTFNAYNETQGWVELLRVSDFIFPSRLATMRFDVESDLPFTKILLDVEDNNQSVDIQLLKFQVFGEEFTSDVKEIDTADLSVWANDGKIHLQRRATTNCAFAEKKNEYKIFNLYGQILTSGVLTNANVDISLPQGAYIVSVGNEKIKIIN